MFINGWMDKENVAYTYNKILQKFTKEEILSFATRKMKLEDITLSEVSQSQNEKYWIPFI